MANVKQHPQCQVELQAAWLKSLVLKVTLLLVLIETVWSFAISTDISTINTSEATLEKFSPSFVLSSRITLNTIFTTNATGLKPNISGRITETQPLDSQTSVFTSMSFSSLKRTSSIQETSSTSSVRSSMLYHTSQVMSNTSQMMVQSRISISSSFVNSTRKIKLSNSSWMHSSQSTKTFAHFRTASQSSKQMVLNTSFIKISPSLDLRRTYYSDISSQISSLQGLASSSKELVTLSLVSPMNTSPQTSSAHSSHYRSVGINATQSLVYLTSSSVPVCAGSSSCNDNKKQPKNKEFLYMILGVGIGAAVLFFVILMAVFICMKRRKQRKPSTHYKRSGKRQSERAGDELLETKESVFNSSTLQLGKGIYNDGLEMDDSLMCILPSSPKTGETIEDNSQSTFRPQQDVQPEPLTVHVSMEQVDRIPSGIQPSAMFGLSQEVKHDASIRLLQDWHEEFSDSRSEEYKELKSDVESSIRDVYRSKEGFRDVTLESFRKGSVIANMSLILLAVVKNPLELLEKSVSQGKVGNLSVDKHFSVTQRKDNDNASDDDFFDKRQPYMQRILSKGGTRKPTTNTDQDTTNASESDASGIESPPSAGSPSSDSFLLDTKIHGGQVTRKSTSDQKDDESESTTSNFRPTSLIDLRRVEPIKFRDQRDSGIGSMQELSRSESNRISMQDIIPENAEQVFYDIPETQDVAVPQNSTADKKVAGTELKSPADQGIAHVALFDFVGKDSRELSVKQGELVYVTQKESLGWVKVVNPENYRGWVPASFLVLVSQSQLASTQQTVETLEFFDNVLDQLEEESGSELSAASTPETEVYLEPVRTDAEIDTMVGEDSHDYLTIIPDKNTEMQASQCKAVFAFTANDPSEMSFEQGVVISILKTTNSGWWKGRIMEQEGWFPSSYVMPLKESPEDALPDLRTEAAAIISDSAEVYESSSQIPDQQPYSEPVIYDEPEIPSEIDEHKYQSLKKQFKPPENYANLYLQILKRESAVEEDIEKYAAAIQVKLKEADPERPLRSPPVPPRDEARDKPAVPPRAKTQIKEEEKRKKVIQLSSKPKVVSAHGEPPKRPVPPPPTAKPALIPATAKTALMPPTAKPALIPASHGKKKDDVIFLDKELTSKTKPASKIDYENVPKKPSRSTEFIKKENIKHPVEVVSLVNELRPDESSAGSNVVLVKNSEKDTSSAIVTNRTAVTSAKVTEDIQSSSRDTSISKDVVGNGHHSSEGKLTSTDLTHAKKPLKPLPKLDSFDKSVLDAPVPISRSKNMDKVPSPSNISISTEPKPTERPRKQLPNLAPTRQLPKEDSTPPIAINKRGISKPVPDSKTGHDNEANIKLDNRKDVKTPLRPHQRPVVKKPVHDSQLDSKVLKSTKIGQPADSKGLKSQEKEPKSSEIFDNVKTQGKPSVDSRERILVGNTATSTSVSTSAISLDSTDSAKSVTKNISIKNIQPGSPKPQPPTKPLVSSVKPSVSAAKPSSSATKSSVSSTKPIVAIQPSVPATKPVVPAAKPSASATQPSISAVKPTVFANKPSVSPAKPSVAADKPSISTAKESTSGQKDSPAKKHRDDEIASPKLSEKPRHPAKPVTSGPPKRVTKNEATERTVKPVPAKRITKETVTASSDSRPNEPLSVGDSRSSPVPNDSNTVSSASRKSSAESYPKPETAINPVPVPRPKARPSKESQDAQPKTKPERPSSPPATTVPAKDKPKPDRPSQPDRPPQPSIQSPSKTSTSAVKSKDRSKLRKVVKSYTKTSNKELDLVAGEFLFELACEGDNSLGLLDNGSEGWYPTNHVVVAVNSAAAS